MEDFTLKVLKHHNGCRIDLTHFWEEYNPEGEKYQEEEHFPYSADGNVLGFLVNFNDDSRPTIIWNENDIEF